jgi:hypothetical protein
VTLRRRIVDLERVAGGPSERVIVHCTDDGTWLDGHPWDDSARRLDPEELSDAEVIVLRWSHTWRGEHGEYREAR